MDRHTKEQRSYNMSKVKSKNTKPELYVFSVLDELGLKYKKHYDIPGKPDIAFPKEKIAVFINGEFWHGRRFREESKNYPDFWITKIKSNMKRDRKNYKLLEEENWKVIKIWDKDLKNHSRRELNKIMRAVGYK